MEQSRTHFGRAWIYVSVVFCASHTIQDQIILTSFTEVKYGICPILDSTLAIRHSLIASSAQWCYVQMKFMLILKRRISEPYPTWVLTCGCRFREHLGFVLHQRRDPLPPLSPYLCKTVLLHVITFFSVYYSPDRHVHPKYCITLILELLGFVLFWPKRWV